MNRTAESRQRLWIVPGPLVIWAIHFMLCYITAALWCGRVAGPASPLSTARTAIGVYTVVALAGIGAIAWMGYRAQALGAGEPPHDADSPEDRHRFLGFAALLIAGLSTVATIYTAMAALFIETCQ
ncbi:MAG TPA: hypothetical protein VMO26_29785 [Vicinamibacterales bacterium]|nr:hypothetical protein [Vicinamibacterales bacterium]